MIKKRLIKADADWYVLPDKLWHTKGFQDLSWEDRGNKAKVAEWVKDNAEEFATAYGVDVETITSDSYIEKIFNGLFVSSCYDSYSDYFKDVNGLRPRGFKFDESSRQAFEEDYDKAMNRLEEEVKEINESHDKAIKENDKQVDDVINTAKEPEDIAKFKDEHRFELSEDALDKLRKGIDNKIHEKLMEHIDFYTIDELKRFKKGYGNHMTDKDIKLIDNKIKELEKEEEYEKIPVKHGSKKRLITKTATMKEIDRKLFVALMQDSDNPTHFVVTKDGNYVADFNCDTTEKAIEKFNNTKWTK